MFKNIFKWLFLDLTKDQKHNYHKSNCILYGHSFTVIKNAAGMKIWQQYIKYCPVCGAKLRD